CLASGLYGSLWATDPKQVANWVSFPVLMTVVSGFLPMMLPSGLTSVMVGVGSPAWPSYLSLVSYEDVRDAFQPGPYAPPAPPGVKPGEGAGAVVAPCRVGWAGKAVAAALMTRAALRGFDRAVGRPIRPRDPAPSHRGSWVVGRGSKRLGFAFP